MVILTPHIIKCSADHQRILTEESRKQNWVLSDVKKIHGYGTEFMVPPSATPPIPTPTPIPDACPTPGGPSGGAFAPTIPGPPAGPFGPPPIPLGPPPADAPLPTPLPVPVPGDLPGPIPFAPVSRK